MASSVWWVIALDAAIKGLAVLALAAGICLTVRSLSAATRHLIWFLALCSQIALPVMSLMLPQWRAPILPDWAAPVTATYVAPQTPRSQSVPTIAPPADAEQQATLPGDNPDRQPTSKSPATSNDQAVWMAMHWSLWLAAAWSVGAILLAMPWLIGRLSLARLQRRCQLVDSGPAWSAMERLCLELDVVHRVRLLRGTGTMMPMTWGTHRPVLVLPGDADTWPAQRLRVVLRHELAHVKRCDHLTQSVALAIRIILWFNPMVWVAVVRMRVERERACDDLVLAGGSQASEYAEHLLGIVRSLRSSSWRAAAAVAMARRSTLEGRLLAILDARRSRWAPAARTWAGGAIVGACLITPRATLHATAKIALPQPAGDAMIEDIADIVDEPLPLPDDAQEPAQTQTPRQAVAAAAITGTVVDEQGRPLAGAQVTIVTPDAHGHINPEGLFNHKRKPVLLTGITGRFSFSPADPPYDILVIHDQGMARVSAEALGESSNISIQPWGRVQGELRIGAQTAAGQGVMLWRQLDRESKQTQVIFQLQTITDDAGRFVFDRVPPGKALAGRLLESSQKPARITTVDVQRGENDLIMLGGTGRPVTGRFVVSPASATPSDTDQSVQWRLGHQQVHPHHEQNKYPDNWPDTTTEQLRSWYDNWQASLKSESNHPIEDHYGFEIASDGSFRIDDVRAGDYLIKMHVHAAPRASQQKWGPIVATLDHQFSVPAMPDGRLDESVDLGELTAKMYRQLRIGGTAPPLEVRTLDGQTVRLADFAGKFVLLEFWASWCPPCAEELPHLKEVYQRFIADNDGDGSLVMLSVSLEADIQAAAAFVQKHQIPWRQATLGDWNKTPTPHAYGVRSIPAIFLIGPDGQIIASELRGPNIAHAVNAAVGRTSE